jgi:hypothetical protein
VRDLITTLLEVAGLLLVDAGVAAGVAERSVPAGLIVGGLLLLGSSLLIVKASGRKTA